MVNNSPTASTNATPFITSSSLTPANFLITRTIISMDAAMSITDNPAAAALPLSILTNWPQAAIRTPSAITAAVSDSTIAGILSGSISESFCIANAIISKEPESISNAVAVSLEPPPSPPPNLFIRISSPVIAPIKAVSIPARAPIAPTERHKDSEGI